MIARVRHGATPPVEHMAGTPIGGDPPVAFLKVLLVDGSDRGGIKRYTERLRDGLVRAGLDVALAAPGSLGDQGLELCSLRWGPSMAEASRTQARMVRLAELWPAASALVHAVRRANPHIVHLQTEVVPGVEPLLVRLMRRQVKVVITVHDPVPLEGGARRAARQARRWRAADALVLHGEEHRGFVEASAPGVPVHVVPVDLLLGGPAVDRAEARCRLDLGTGSIALLLGQLRPYKGLDLLGEAWAQVAASLPGARLLLVGETYESAQMDRLLGIPGVELRSGFVPEDQLHLWASAADVLVLPYQVGSHSGILHQGLAVGTPVLASPVLAGEVHRTRAGRIVALDQRAWSEALIECLGTSPLPPPPAPSGRQSAEMTAELYRSLVPRASVTTQSSRRVR